MRARAHVHACARARRTGPPATAAPALSATRRQRRKVDKCRVADKKQTDKPTNKPTNKHTLLFYRYRYIYIYIGAARTIVVEVNGVEELVSPGISFLYVAPSIDRNPNFSFFSSFFGEGWGIPCKYWVVH